MLTLKLQNPATGLKVLCLGAHCDDIEIGCGGTIMKLMSRPEKPTFKWVVFTSNEERAEEAHKSAERILHDADQKDISIMKFSDGFLPQESTAVKKYFEELKSFQPDIVFTHYRHDLHQDHRLVCDFTWNTFRNHFIMEYEIPKYDGDLGQPNFFVTLDAHLAESKTQHIMDYFPSQRGKQWFEKETFYALMRLRGVECAAKEKYAEGFYVKKMKLGL